MAKKTCKKTTRKQGPTLKPTDEFMRGMREETAVGVAFGEHVQTLARTMFVQATAANDRVEIDAVGAVFTEQLSRLRAAYTYALSLLQQ